MNKSYRRRLRHFLINPKYQLKIILWTTLSGLALIAINSSIFYWFMRENYKVLVDLSPMEDDVKIQLYRELDQILGLVLLFSLAALLATALFGLVVSHRTAGPLYHMKRVFKAVRRGDSNMRVRLRALDDFRDVADEANAMIDTLQRKP